LGIKLEPSYGRKSCVNYEIKVADLHYKFLDENKGFV